MTRFFCIFSYFLFFSALVSAQVSGVVTDEEGNRLSAVLVINMSTGQKTYTNRNGEFSISVAEQEEIRFVRMGFDRVSKKVKKMDFTDGILVRLMRTSGEIEEVKITSKPTGNLDQDSRNVGDSRATQTLKIETGKYIAAKSSFEVLAPKRGEFIQPVGPGFSMGAIDSKWDDLDFMVFLIDRIGKDFFTKDLELEETEIQHFVFYIFRNFDRREILKYGKCSLSDVARFVSECNKKWESYRNNLPNDPPKKKEKK